MVADGHRAAMLYLVHRGDTTGFALARDIDPAYAAAFDNAAKAGVEMLAYRCSVLPDEVTVTERIPILG
jgi:sugar fermentation stimulation protein A